MKSRTLVWILWPSFVVAGVVEGVFFTLFDPMELLLFGAPIGWSRTAVYSVGFFVFWAVCAASSAFTCLLQRSATEINRCPLQPGERPAGCPKREDAGTC
ncbi:MAG TPA: hypothetical protein VNM24_11635 [Burkholderiales bacterium]|jgi:hypothetical protein|nr:hypothetical protein [Burkholderiales bacterium]